MAKIDGPKYTGPVVIDLTVVKDHLVDLPPGGLKGARGPKPGLNDVLAELAHAMPNYATAAEIHPAVYQRVVAHTAAIADLRAKELELEKSLEVCRETRGMLENNREEDISSIATTVENKVQKGNDPGLGAHFEKTVNYKSAYAAKAADTRRQNDEAKAAEAKAAEEAAKAKAGGGQTPPV